MAAIEFTNKNCLILGCGRTGLSLVRWLLSKGAKVSIADDGNFEERKETLRKQDLNIKLLKNMPQKSEISKYDVFAVSPGISKSHPVVQYASEIGKLVLGDVELFFRARASIPNAIFVGITGSNGKTTVTKMIGAICEAGKKSYCMVGNVGEPVLDLLTAIETASIEEPEVVVVELSSFQLDYTTSQNLDIALLLNISEDHMDRYESFNKYVESKLSIFKDAKKRIIHQKEFKRLVFSKEPVTTYGIDNGSDSESWQLRREKDSFLICRGLSPLMSTKELKVTGLHNIENAMAAAAAGEALGFEFSNIAEGLRSFKSLPHRFSFIARIGEIDFIDDSKATNVGAVIAALQEFNGNAILILGGDGKGQDFLPLKRCVSESCRGVVLIGRDAKKIGNVLSGIATLSLDWGTDLSDAVKKGHRLARAGDSVILSPGCASFDMFIDYRHRASVFKKCVENLARAV